MIQYSDIEVDYIDGYGSDLLVVNSARVSFHKASHYLTWSDHPFEVKNKEHSLYPDYQRYVAEKLAVHTDPTSKVGPLEILNFNDFRLIHFLSKKGHWTPFGHGSFTLKLKVPIFVARQLAKHQVGLVWNEVSRRYYDGPVEFFRMDFKKSSGDKRQEGVGYIERDSRLDEHEELGLQIYLDMLAAGGAAEDVRSVLPQNMMTEFYWSGSVAAFMRVTKWRVPIDTQRQTRIVGEKIAEILHQKVPVSYMAYNRYLDKDVK